MSRMEEVEMSPQIKISSRHYDKRWVLKAETRAFRGMKRSGLLAKSWSALIRMH